MAPSRTEKLQRLFEVAASQAGHFTAAQAREVGYSPRSLVHHVAAGHVERVSRGLYRLVGVPVEPHEDVVAAWLRWSTQGAAVSHDTALTLYELALSRSHDVHLTLPRAQRPRNANLPSGVKIHTTSAPLRRAEVARRFGVLVTQPARTIADVADVGGDPSVVVEAVRRGLGNGLVSAPELRHAVKDRSVRVRSLVERALQKGDAGA